MDIIVKGINMKYLIICLLVLESQTAFGGLALERLLDLRLFGIHYDTINNLGLDSVILEKANLLREAEAGDTFSQSPEVLLMYRFNELPGISLYNLTTYVFNQRESEENYEWLLVNSNDTTVYHFGQDIGRFSLIMGNWISPKLGDTAALNLINLFLNTNSCEEIVYILKSREYFNRFIDERFSDYGYSNKQAKTDKKRVKHIIKPPRIERTADRINIKLYTWNYRNGALQFWNFRITEQVITIDDKCLIFENIGPYQGISPY
jgi:hypothetical protein